jgi:hypothetical protein
MEDISGIRGGQNHAPTATLATVSPTYSGRVTAGFRLMHRRFASINDKPIKADERKYFWPSGRRPDDHPSLSDLGL